MYAIWGDFSSKSEQKCGRKKIYPFWFNLGAIFSFYVQCTYVSLYIIIGIFIKTIIKKLLILTNILINISTSYFFFSVHLHIYINTIHLFTFLLIYLSNWVTIYISILKQWWFILPWLCANISNLPPIQINLFSFYIN